MTDSHIETSRNGRSSRQIRSKSVSNRVKRRRRGIAMGASALVGIAVLGGSAAWLGITATRVSQELQAANGLVPALRSALLDNDVDAAKATVDKLMQHTKAAREDTTDPLWVIAGELPWIGANFKAASEVALSADDVSRLGAGPLVSVFQSLDWKTLAPDEDGIDLAPLAAAEPKLVSASHAVRQSSDRLSSIDADELLPQISGPLVQARDQLSALRDGLDAAANTASLAPDMLGGTSPRRYLVLIQNNAELRASGGIPGALAILSVDKGKLTLNNQTSASKFGTTSPAIPVTQEQQNIYSSRLGKYMQDVNLTPDFPSAAGTARAMWEQKTGEHLDGVISVDPVALSYVLAATGPVQVTAPELLGLTGGLPSELTSSNVVQTLLSDVYKEIDRPTVQDAYFASAAQQIFGAISGGNTDATNLIESLTRGAQEGRVLLWSSTSDEQAILDRYTISGAVDGPSIAPAQFGVYFNDGTGAKMDYYVKRTVQLVKECPKDGYEQTTVRITSTNVAPEDAASALPAYVTGDGIFGVPPGSVQTNIVTYGPALANIESARLGGQRIEFAPYLHGNRPVGVISVRLAPGETQTVDFTFGKIVQHAEPNIFVTPTVEDIKDVILVTENSPCTPSP